MRLWPRTALSSQQLPLMLSRHRPRGKVAARSEGAGGVCEPGPPAVQGGVVSSGNRLEPSCELSAALLRLGNEVWDEPGASDLQD
ncbi:Hypothetical predicted protein [Marmota monax]|uniref:Uncharacterized protein n=1 Tax=Marmota monax TaxID=9995 RepID=A0A5E4C4W3_MARMO|nr:Hypothetical predicted protein [Marmota monax]